MTETFTAGLKEANPATKPDIADFAKETDFENKLNNINKKVNSIKQNMQILKTNSLIKQKQFHKCQKNDMTFCLVECILQALFAPMLNPVTLDNNKKVTNLVSTTISSEKN